MSNDAGKSGRIPASTENTKGDEAFLRRWSRRKHEARTDVEQVADAAPPASLPDPPAAQPVLTDADMPPIESLNEDSDYSPFMSPGVSETLRRQALRKLFTLPSINQREILNSEYYDCHGFEPLGSIVTHEMREEMERQAQKLAQELHESIMEDQSPATAAAVAAPFAAMEKAPETPPPEESAMTHKRKLTKRRRT